MRILFHIPFNTVGGAETQIKYLIKNLQNAQVLVTYEWPEAEAFAQSLGVVAKRVHSPNTLAHAIMQFRPDVIQYYHSHTMYNALRKQKHGNARVVEVVHNRLGFGGDATSYPKNLTHAVVCVSPDARDYFHSKCPDVPAHVIPNGVDTEYFKKPHSWHAPRARLRAGFTGRLEGGEGKGIPELIEIMRGFPHVDFFLVGTDFGGYASINKKYPNIFWRPYTNDPIQYYHDWDFFVSNSPAEGFGLSIAEAIHCGLPAVVRNCGGVTKFLEHEKHALIANSSTEMREMIDRVIRDDHALEPDTLDLSAKSMAEKYQELYDNLMLKKKSIEAIIPAMAVDRLGVVEDSWHGVRRAVKPLVDHIFNPHQAATQIRRLRPKVVVLGCYNPAWESVLVAAKSVGAKVVCTWHASFILNEFDHVNRVWMHSAIQAYKMGLIHRFATPHEGLAKTFTHYGVRTDFLPNVVDALSPIDNKLEGVHIGILGSGQAWKNMECQIIAAGMVEGATVHLQNLKHPEIVRTFGVKYEIHPHLPTDEAYYKLVSSMTVNMVVSLSEVYSYFAAESILLGTPIITTPITPILQGATHNLQNYCVNPHFEDPVKLADSIRALIREPAYSHIRQRGREHMLQLNKKNVAIVEKAIESWYA